MTVYDAIRTESLVLRRTNYGEADRILQLITPLGRRSAIAKGARLQKSKLAGGIELFMLSDIVLAPGRGSLDMIRSSRSSHVYMNVMADYDRLQLGYQFLKHVTKASESLDEPAWFDLLVQSLSALDRQTIDTRLAESWFYLHYTSILGEELNLQTDTNAERLRAESSYRYDAADKALTPTVNGAITASHIKLLRLLSNNSLEKLVQVGGIAPLLDTCRRLCLEHAAVS